MQLAARTLTAWIIAALAQVDIHAAPDTGDPPRSAVLVVVHDYAGVPPATLAQATQTVTRVYEPLGIHVRWSAPRSGSGSAPLAGLDVSADQVVHFRIFRRDRSDGEVPGILGIDAPKTRDDATAVSHVLYQAVGDHTTSGLALAYVMSRLILSMTSTNGRLVATIVRGDRQEAMRLTRGEAPFTREEVNRLRADAAAR